MLALSERHTESVLIPMIFSFPMPGKLYKRNEYDLVEEAYDGKVPVHNEDAFEHGLQFKIKVRVLDPMKLFMYFLSLPMCEYRIAIQFCI